MSGRRIIKLKMDQLHVTGMTCAACASRIEKALRKEKGIQSVQVSLALSRAVVHYEPKQIGMKAIIARIAKLGYRATDKLAHPQAGIEVEARTYRTRFTIAVWLSVPLLWAMLTHLSAGFSRWTPDLFMEPMFQLLLATVLQFGVGYPFYYGAYQALIHRSANMDTLVVISTSVAYFYSHYTMFQMRQESSHPMLYFDTIAMIMTAVLLGKWLEAIARGKALNQLSALYSLQEKLVRIMRKHGEEWSPAGKVQTGDLVAVKSGEWISVDGIVRSGTADIDESMMTGESAAIAKRSGDRVYAGTRCLTGSLHIAVDRKYEDTRLSRMIRLVEAAQQGKPAIQRTADRIAAVFVPIMIGCAVMTYAGWLVLSHHHAVFETAMRHALSVLLIACPCALGLATPISILIATGTSARKGILFKEGRSLERLRQVDVVLLDKTGTLTEGLPQLEAIHTAEINRADTLRLSAALASLSAHPLAQAIVRATCGQQASIPQATAFQEWPGKGMEGYVDGKRVCVGNRKWLEELGVRFPERERRESDRTANPGLIRLYAAVNGNCIGTFVLSDKLRKDARKVVQELKRRVEVWMVTGDEEQAAVAAAAEAGIERVRSGMLPEQKLAFIRELQQQGRTVAMVGDGINDAAALAAADVGIAMGAGTDAAKQAGDVVLTGNKLSRIMEAYAWSRSTMRNVHQNLIFALLYNVLAVPLAACGYLDPRIACIGMAASSVLVVGNSLRLQLRGMREGAAWR